MPHNTARTSTRVGGKKRRVRTRGRGSCRTGYARLPTTRQPAWIHDPSIPMQKTKEAQRAALHAFSDRTPNTPKSRYLQSDPRAASAWSKIATGPPVTIPTVQIESTRHKCGGEGRVDTSRLRTDTQIVFGETLWLPSRRPFSWSCHAQNDSRPPACRPRDLTIPSSPSSPSPRPMADDCAHRRILYGVHTDAHSHGADATSSIQPT